MDAVVKNIHVGPAETLPDVVLSVSPCRSGTTVMLRVFGASGVQSHFQELKNVLRWGLQGRFRPWAMPQKPGKLLYLKETLGPFIRAEAEFNPLRVLIEAGCPPEKLNLLVIGRAPLETWASWKQWWEGKSAVETFLLSCNATAAAAAFAERRGVPVTFLVYEAFRDNDVARVISRLFDRLHAPFTDVTVRGWGDLPAFGSDASNIVLPEEPPAFVTPRIHDQPQSAVELSYFSREDDIYALPREEAARIAESDAPDIYDTWRRRCATDLNIHIRPDDGPRNYMDALVPKAFARP